MQSESIISGRRMHLDNSVWLVMIITAIFCLGLVSYRFISKEPCVDFSINVTGLTKNNKSTYQLGETLIFKASLATDKEIIWDFGDKTETQRSNTLTVRHTFTKEGIFNVSALVNGRCTSDEVRLQIKKEEAVAGVPIAKAPKILGNVSPKAGKTETYISDIIGSDYEWKILDKTTFPTINSQSASFTFPKAGLYVLQLTIDHDRNNKRSLAEITVTEESVKANIKPPPLIIISGKKKEDEKGQDNKQINPPIQPPNPPPKIDPNTEPIVTRKIINISNDGFKNKLQGVIEGQNDVKDFDRYLMEKGETKILINNEKSSTFQQFCDEIRGKQKITIEEVELIKNEENQIQRIKVKYKKKGGFLGL